MTTLTKKQTQTMRVLFSEDGKKYVFIATLRFDDECGNGHNTFSITGELWRSGASGAKLGSDCIECGMLHKRFAKMWPHMAKYIKWHLTSTDGPLHYVANTLFWVGIAQKGGDKYRSADDACNFVRDTAVWPELLDEEILNTDEATFKKRLEDRLPALMVEFQKDMEALGFTW